VKNWSSDNSPWKIGPLLLVDRLDFAGAGMASRQHWETQLAEIREALTDPFA
jgi:hypothetical protein